MDDPDAVGAETAAGAPGGPAKKRTRRGTRGGRNRKKPAGAPGAAAASANGGEAATEAGPVVDEAVETVEAVAAAEVDAEDRPDEDGPVGPVIHVPGRELGEAEDGDGTAATAKKRTRRGSRGGKNRRKKPLVAGEAAATELLDPESDASADSGLEPDFEPAPADEREPEPSLEPEQEPERASRPEPELPSENGDGEWTYTPMSRVGRVELETRVRWTAPRRSRYTSGEFAGPACDFPRLWTTRSSVWAASNTASARASTLVVDRLKTEEGKSFSPDVLLGDDGVKVTATVLAHERGPKILIGKYRKRTGYKRHNGFRAATSRIEISLGAPEAARAEEGERSRPRRLPSRPRPQLPWTRPPRPTTMSRACRPATRN